MGRGDREKFRCCPSPSAAALPTIYVQYSPQPVDEQPGRLRRGVYTEVQGRLLQRTMESDKAAALALWCWANLRHPHPPTEMLLPSALAIRHPRHPGHMACCLIVSEMLGNAGR